MIFFFVEKRSPQHIVIVFHIYLSPHISMCCGISIESENIKINAISSNQFNFGFFALTSFLIALLNASYLIENEFDDNRKGSSFFLLLSFVRRVERAQQLRVLG